MSRKRVPLNQNECTADFRIGVPFEQNLHNEIGSDVDPLFYRMLDEYKEFMCVYADKIEKEVEDVELPTLTPEQWEENKQKLYARIREKYGEDAI